MMRRSVDSAYLRRPGSGWWFRCSTQEANAILRRAFAKADYLPAQILASDARWRETIRTPPDERKLTYSGSPRSSWGTGGPAPLFDCVATRRSSGRPLPEGLPDYAKCEANKCVSTVYRTYPGWDGAPQPAPVPKRKSKRAA
jgi:hypothetical protein